MSHQCPLSLLTAGREPNTVVRDSCKYVRMYVPWLNRYISNRYDTRYHVMLSTIMDTYDTTAVHMIRTYHIYHTYLP